MPAKVLFLGFDAMNAALTERWAAAGKLPAFASVIERARAFRVQNFMDILPGSIWTDIPTGRPPSIHCDYFHGDQYRSAEGVLRRIEPEDSDASRYLWSDTNRAGLRSAVIDVPFLVFQDDFNGVQINEFANHDLLYGFRAEPAERFANIRERYGPLPIHGAMCDIFAERDGIDALHKGLLERADVKTRLLTDLLEEDWHLFYAVYGESHCASHYAWPEPGETGDRFDRLLQVYRRLDAGLAAVIAKAGPDAKVVVTLSHGAGPYLGGPQLLPEVLNRLGWTTGRDPAWRSRLRTGLLSAAQRLPTRVRKPLRRLAGSGRGRIEGMLGRTHQPFQHPECRAVAVWNNRCGAIRFNVIGRDPHGTIPPEAFEDQVAELTRQLMALRQPGTGEPVIAGVDRVSDVLPPPLHPDLPDLTVRFRTDIGLIEACEGEGIQPVHVPIRRVGYDRRGDHTPDNRTYVIAPGYQPGRVDQGSVLDIAPTVLSLCGVEPPSGMTGAPLPPGA